jgi:hypothetical protein
MVGSNHLMLLLSTFMEDTNNAEKKRNWPITTVEKIFSKLFSPNILNSQQPIFVLKGWYYDVTALYCGFLFFHHLWQQLLHALYEMRQID